MSLGFAGLGALLNPEYAAAVPHVRIHPQLVSFPFNLLTEKTNILSEKPTRYLKTTTRFPKNSKKLSVDERSQAILEGKSKVMVDRQIDRTLCRVGPGTR